MIVKIVFAKASLIDEERGLGEYERMIECDTIHKYTGKDKLELTLYKDGKHVETADFKDQVEIFIMEKGKTIERLNFKSRDSE